SGWRPRRPRGSGGVPGISAVASTPLSPRAAEVTQALFECYGKPIYRYCRARLHSREDAEDAIQSVFLRAHGALSRGVVPQLEAAWLYKIAHNVCVSGGVSAARRRQIETPRDLDALQDE